MQDLTSKLSIIQQKLKANKSQYNSFGKYHYRSTEDILEALKPHLTGGLIVTIDDEIVAALDRVYIKATATITDGKDKIQVSAYAREAQDKKGMDESQITGSTSSYARKYALNGLFLIDDSKDADSTNTHGKEDKENVEKKIQDIPKQNGFVTEKAVVQQNNQEAQKPSSSFRRNRVPVSDNKGVDDGI